MAESNTLSVRIRFLQRKTGLENNIFCILCFLLLFVLKRQLKFFVLVLIYHAMADNLV